ncbi:hypothetical protein ACFLVS_05785 [Chloroflexota bacterium]
MFSQDRLIMMAMGGLLVVVGIALFVWGKSGEKRYYDPSAGMDVTGFLENEIEPRLESLKVGGRIAIAVGSFLLVMGGVLLLLG